MRISDWSSDVCSSDLRTHRPVVPHGSLPHRRAVTCPGRERLGRRPPDVADLGLRRASRGAQEPAAFSAYCGRSEERSVGKECVSTCRSRWSPYTAEKITLLERET